MKQDRRHTGFRLQKRHWLHRWMMSLILCSVLIAMVPLLSIFGYVLQQGLPALNWNFLTQLPAPTGEVGGGMGNAILGSLSMILMASLWGVPIGISCGVYLSEYKIGFVAQVLRQATDLLSTLPSIVVGLFVYVVLVVPMKNFSAWAGSLALSILMIPMIIKTTEEILRLLPQHVREAGLSLGIPRWRVIISIVLKGSAGPLTTGVLLSIARISGETAPLLLTAFGNNLWMQSLNQPTPSLPVQIYNYAISPYAHWHQQAWAGAFVLVFLVMCLNLVSRLVMKKR